MVQRPALAVAEHMGDAENSRLAGRQQLLAGELRRGVEIERRARAAGRRPARSRRRAGAPRCRANLQRRGLDLEEAAPAKPVPQRRQDAAARQQERPPVGVDSRSHQGEGSVIAASCARAFGAENAGERGQDQYGAARNARAWFEALAPDAKQRNSTCEGHRQLASQGQCPGDRRQALRRAERRKLPSRQGHADHPGRHAPDQRRREDVSSATRPPSRSSAPMSRTASTPFLYSDGEGFHFMNSENYDQITLAGGSHRRSGRLSAARDEGDAQRA